MIQIYCNMPVILCTVSLKPSCVRLQMKLVQSQIGDYILCRENFVFKYFEHGKKRYIL